MVVLNESESGHMIDCKVAKIIQKGFCTYKKGLTGKALHLWVNKNSLNRKDVIELATFWQMIM